MDGLKVLPSLFQEGDQEVDGHSDVLSQLFFCHLFVSDSDGHAGNFLKLELDTSSNIIDLVLQGFSVSNDLGEHTDSIQDGSQDGRDLLDDSISGKKN